MCARLSLSLSLSRISGLAGACLAGLLLAGSAQAATPLPFQADFEAAEGYTVGPVAADPVWSIGTDLDASIITPGAGSEQAFSFTGSDRLSISFLPSASSVSWVDYYLRPEAVQLADLPVSFVPARAAATGFVAVDGQGEVFVVDGDGLGGGTWLGAGSLHPLSGTAATDWVRLTYRLDFSAKTWDLFVDSELVLTDLGFLNDSFSSLSQFYFDGHGTAPTQLDYFYAGDVNPLFTDTANDGIPDAWLLANGLDINFNQRDGDPDGDGLSNLQEYLHGTDPNSSDTDGDGLSDAAELALGSDPNNPDSDGDGLSDGDEIALGKNPLADDVDGLSGYVRRDIWYLASGFGIKPMINLATFPILPNESQLVTSLDFPQPEDSRSHYGQRVYGWIVAPTTADYTFYIATSGVAEFWLSSDDSASNRDLAVLASLPTAYRDWNSASKPVRLEAGQRYFFELLHRHRDADDFLSLGWSFAGNPIAPVGGAALQVIGADADDADGDGLPDAWELANGLDPQKGYAEHGYFGDFDRDFLPNFKERFLGTKPNNGDTDGDRYRDGMEVNTLFSDPTVAEFNLNEVSVVTALSGADFVASKGLWQREGGVAYVVDATGSLTYEINLQQSGAYRLVVEVTENNQNRGGNSLFELEALLDGHSYGQLRAWARPGRSAEVEYYLPFIEAGVHSIEIKWLNGLFSESSFLAIQSIRLEELGGTDADASGVADWVETRAARFGSETEPTQVYVSPYFFEGRSFTPERMSIRSHAEGAPELVREELVKQGLQYGYYTDIVLQPDETRIIEIDDQFGLRTVQYPITWEAFNLFEHDFIHIRKDGSLLIEAIDPDGSAPQELTLTLQAPSGSLEMHTLPADGRLQALFDQAGDWTVSTTLPPVAGEDPLVLSATVRVSSASLNPAPIILGQNRRTWVPGLSDADVEMYTDPDLQLIEPELGLSPRSFQLSSSRDGARIVARLPDGGPILDATAAQVIQDYSRSQTYNKIVETFADGSVLVSAYIYLSEVPEDLSIEINTWKSGVTFEDGTVWRTITAEDFDEQGRYRFYMLRAPGVSGGNCHRYWIQQDGQNIGTL